MKKTEIVRELVAIANELDADGKTDLADSVDAVIEDTAGDDAARAKVHAAIDDADKSGYLEKVLSQRNPSSPGRLGSFFHEDHSKESLKSAKWRPYSHPAISAPAEGYVADIPGTVGMVDLHDLDPETEVKVSDPKGTHGTKGGGYSVEVQMPSDDLPKSKQTVALVGPGKDGPTLWTVFPGEPYGASIVGTHPDSPIRTPHPEEFDTSSHEMTMTVGDAIRHGFRYGKVSAK